MNIDCEWIRMAIIVTEIGLEIKGIRKGSVSDMLVCVMSSHTTLYFVSFFTQQLIFQIVN